MQLRDRHGLGFELILFDKEGARLNSTLNDLENEYVFKALHDGERRGNQIGGKCLACALVGPFFIVDGVEYCGICNAEYDTFGGIKDMIMRKDGNTF